MNREALYCEIGNIDDDLIQAANETHGYRMQMIYRIAGIAACFFLICGGILFGLQKDIVHFNEIPAPGVSKAMVPADEDTTTVSMTYQELLAYYGMEQMPDTVGEELIKTRQTLFAIYQNPAGEIIYDTNILYYTSADGSKKLSVTLAKAGEDAAYENGRPSRIDGVPVLLAFFSNGTDSASYWADFQLKDVSVQIISDGMSKDGFIDATTELIRCMK